MVSEMLRLLCDLVSLGNITYAQFRKPQENGFSRQFSADHSRRRKVSPLNNVQHKRSILSVLCHVIAPNCAGWNFPLQLTVDIACNTLHTSHLICCKRNVLFNRAP